VRWPLFVGFVNQSKNAKKIVRKHKILATPQYRDRIWRCIPSAKQQASTFIIAQIHCFSFVLPSDY
jgi:hypothetical protein